MPNGAVQTWRLCSRQAGAKSLAWVAFADLLAFFGVLLVGFAYLWRRGDLDWARSLAAQQATGPAPEV